MTGRLANLVLVCGLTLAACAPGDHLPGEPCDTDDDCAEGNACAAVHMSDAGYVYQCIARCDDVAAANDATFLLGGRCASGELCWVYRGDELHSYGCLPGGDIPIGAPCVDDYFSCELGAYCEAWIGAETISYCTAACNVHGCHLGEHCSRLTDCEVGLACAAVGPSDTPAANECVEACTSPNPAADTPSLCASGELCWRTTDDASDPWACYPGGDQPVGGPCTQVSDCERGSACSGSAGSATCVPACNTDADCTGASCDGGLCTP